ncbi:hypothetical protein PV08_05158 [Exophiala spinifera]|uniref:Enoyl reductase (ER) domain-containing protein n=1 Tax=Exophiala spinifera TaxID=91928 RepID=A0A0D2BG65_9EURO|nr:uncharacterized protein PV08_05158 [Exophiala spinifera]KIW17963.1 hypothetical protein PV08_05158 [Exophiala spinifera]
MSDFTVPKQAKAIIYSQPGTTETKIVDVEVPEPQDGEILVRITHSGVCHTDYSLATQRLGHVRLPEGQIGGHEGVGIVVKLGPGVTARKLGERIGIKWIASSCLTCDMCLYGYESKCALRKVSGLGHPGTFQQYLVTHAQYATPIPPGVDSAKAAPLLCGGITVYVALQRADLSPGNWVAVSGGGGGLGSLAIQYAKTMGLHVLAIDHTSKADFCRSIGADAFLDFTKFGGDDGDKALVDDVKRITDGGAHAILVCNSSAKSYDQSLDMVRYGGTVVCVGLPESSSAPISCATPSNMIMNRLTIKGTMIGNRKDAVECLQPLARGQIDPQVTVRPMSHLSQVRNFAIMLALNCISYKPLLVTLW